MTVELPTLRPTARHKAYYDELRDIDAAVGDAIEADVKKAREHGGITLGKLFPLALRYRLKMAALVAILEDRGLLSVGTYDRMKGCKVVQDDGTAKPFAPMHELRRYIAAHGLPEAAPGCEEAA